MLLTKKIPFMENHWRWRWLLQTRSHRQNGCERLLIPRRYVTSIASKQGRAERKICGANQCLVSADGPDKARYVGDSAVADLT